MRFFPALIIGLVLLAGNAHAASFEELFQKGQEAYKAGNFSEAANYLRLAGDELQKKKDSRAPLLWGNAAIASIQAKDFETAADLYERILALKNPPKEQLLQYYANLVHSRGQLKQPALQIEAIERQLKALPKMAPETLAETYSRLGDAYRDQELYRPAASAYDKALHVLPKNAKPEQRAKLLVALGLCQRYIGDFAGAEKSLLQARKLAEQLGQDLSIAEADSNLAGLRMDQGDYSEAIKLYLAAIDREKKAGLRLNEGSDWNNLGIARRSNGNYEHAMDHINEAIAIAKEVGNQLGEAIALQNRALGFRIAGQPAEARKDYIAAMKLYEQVGEKLGKGTTLMGMGRMSELVDKNYAQALQDYTEALKIFQELELPRWEATANLYLGHLHKRINEPGRATRDLVFDDEPTLPQLSPAEAIEQAAQFYRKALDVGEKLGSKELIWEASQGLGFVDYKAGKLESALAHYQKAIDIVTGMHVSADNARMLGDFMAGREDLYMEAIEIAAALYDKTGDQKYLDLQRRYNETLKNEVYKASAALANIKFQDSAQQKLYDRYKKAGQELAKSMEAIPAVPELPANPSSEEKKAHSLALHAAVQQKAAVKKLESDYKKVVAEWKAKYPKDEAMFSTLDANVERMDIKAIQGQLTPEQALIQYVSLPGSLLVTVITSDKVDNFRVDVTAKTLKKLIYDDFVVGYIHKGFKKEEIYGGNNDKFLKAVYATLHTLYNYLIEPIQGEISDKKRLYIVCDGFLSQIPFSMLVANEVPDGGKADFLIQKYQIANVRPSFMKQFIAAKKGGRIKRMLAVANPENDNFPMKLLRGTIDEVSIANKNLDAGNPVNRDIALVAKEIVGKNKIQDISEEVKKEFPTITDISDHAPTESWLRDKLAKNSYEILYFATHGQAQSDTYTKLAAQEKAQRAAGKDPLKSTQFRKMRTLVDRNIPEPSPLNSFLYLSNEPEDQILDKDKNPTTKDIPRERDGLFTIAEIIGLKDKALKDTRYVLLSACNAAVSLVPFAIGEGYDEKEFLDPKLTGEALASMGLKPEVDQATFVESFMRHGVQNVYASFWQLDDEAGSAIMQNFWEQIKDAGDQPDFIEAFTEAQRKYLADVQSGALKRQNKADIADKMDAIHPYYWAAGAMFGK